MKPSHEAEVRLLGRPQLLIGGVAVPATMRRKGWLLLAVLLLGERPPSRRSLADLLFADAADPLGALRWTLSRMRRALSGHIEIDGDPVTVRVGASCHVDVLDDPLDGGLAPQQVLLDGADGSCGPDFDLWLTAARHAVTRPRAAPGEKKSACVRSRMHAGRSAMTAGAVTAGLSHLRVSARMAADQRDERLEAVALQELGGSLVHGVAVGLPEGRTALTRAAELARWHGDHRTAAEALRDLAYVENAAGRTGPARTLLGQASAAAGGDAYAMSAVNGIAGMFLSDRGEHARGLRALRLSIGQAESAGRTRQVIWSSSIAARSLIQTGDLAAARTYAEQAAHLAGRYRWESMRPWMETLLADLDLAEGRTGEAERRLDDAWSMSLLLEDRCWQAMAARGMGLAHHARGRVDDALRWLDRSVDLAADQDDQYAWISGWTQQALCRVSVGERLPRARADVRGLGDTGRRSAQPDFVSAARRYLSALG
jgi:tetratricopeptide (TPR) repeat protein